MAAATSSPASFNGMHKVPHIFRRSSNPVKVHRGQMRSDHFFCLNRSIRQLKSRKTLTEFGILPMLLSVIYHYSVLF